MDTAPTCIPKLRIKEIKIVPTKPQVKPTLYKLKPLVKVITCPARGGREKPAIKPAIIPKAIPRGKGSPWLNDSSLTNGPRAVPNRAAKSDFSKGLRVIQA